MFPPSSDLPECWPALPLDSWKDTLATLHMWTQIVGKVRLRLTPLVNHWWNVPLYVTARGLGTSRIPYGERSFEIWFDFIRHQLVLETSDGLMKTLPLEPRSVADFYHECHEDASVYGHRCQNLADAGRNSQSDCLRSGSGARVLRSCLGGKILAYFDVGGFGLPTI